MRSKIILILLAILLSCIESFAQAQYGHIVEQNSGHKPLPGVEVLVEKVAPSVSDKNGNFLLNITNMEVGYPLDAHISKTNYVIINQKAVEQWVYTPQKKLDVVMCLESTYKENLAVYYHIGKSRYQQRYKEAIDSIHKQKEENLIADSTWKRKLSEAAAMYNKELELLEEYKETFARINKDDLHGIDSVAMLFVDKGQLDSAIAVYEKERFYEKFTKRLEAVQTLTTEIELMVPSLKRYAAMCAYAGGKGNYDKAGTIYEAIAASDTSNFDNVFEAAVFLQEQNRMIQAEYYYQMALRNIRQRSANNPEVYLPNVATSLNNLGVLQSVLTRYEAAEKSYEEALEICRALAAKNSEAYLPDVAGTLHNLGNMQCVLTRYEAAEKSYEEALKIYRALAEKNPDAYLPDVAMTLNNLGALQSDLTRYEAAEKSYEEALKIRRALAAKNPEAYLPDVAITLNSLGNLQSDLTRYEAAEKSYEEALKIRRELAANNPEAYLPDVAMALNNLGILQYNLTRYEAAEKSYDEALEIYRALAAKNPEAYLPDVAITLNNLGILQYNLTRYEAAEKSYEEALKIYRALAEKNPDAYLPDVAMTLNNLGVLQSDLTRYEAAEESYEEALEIRRTLAANNPEAYLPYVATLLNNLGILQKSLTRYEAAEKSYEDALEILRTLAAKNPEAYLPDVAMTLNNLGNLQNDLTRYEAAEKSYEEGLEIRRDLAAKNPEAYLPYVATSLNNLGILQKSLTRYEAAEKSYEDALEILRTLAAKNPEAYLPDVAMTLNNLGNLQNDLTRYEAAEKSYEEGLEIRRDLAAKNPEAYLPYVATSLNDLGNLQRNLTRYEIAEQSYTEVLYICEKQLNYSYEQTASIHYSLGYCYLQFGKNQHAIEHLLICKNISSDDFATNYLLSFAYSSLHNFTEALNCQEIVNNSLVVDYQKNPEQYKNVYVSSLGNLSFYAVGAKHFSESEQYATEALQLDSTQTWIKTNIISALLLQGKYPKAEKIALEIKDQQNSDGKLIKDIILEDLELFKKENVIPKKYEGDVEKMRELLKN